MRYYHSYQAAKRRALRGDGAARRPDPPPPSAVASPGANDDGDGDASPTPEEEGSDSSPLLAPLLLVAALLAVGVVAAYSLGVFGRRRATPPVIDVAALKESKVQARALRRATEQQRTAATGPAP